jgi:hypothetical protein
MMGVPVIPIVPGISVQPISDCRKGVATCLCLIISPVTALRVRIQF